MRSRQGNASLTFALFLLSVLAIVFPVLAQNCSKDNPCATGCCSKHGWCGTGEDHCGDGNCVDTCDFKLQCDENTPCESGCCSKAGYCGLGPDYCAPDVCVSGCDSKAECDPGFGSKWAKKSKCPLNVCCSEFGFCGTTKEFCGNKTVKHSTCDKKTATLDRVVGYYEAWSTRRPCNAFWPEQIPLGVYTHINFAFATIDPETFEVRPDRRANLQLLKRVTALKNLDPDLKVLIALGGWTFNDPGPTQMVFSDIARSKENQAKFFSSLIQFLSTYNLDGVDLDWEYPVAEDRNGRPEDYENFPTFMANLKAALDSTGGRNELSITLPASYWYLQHFDIVKLERHVSFFNIMSYDLHGKWDLGNKWTGEYLNPHTNLTEIDKALDLLWRNKIDSSKVVMGLAFYARAYTLADPACVKPGCLFASGANRGECSQEVGILLNSEIDQIMADKDLSPTFYEDAAAQVIYWDDQWLSYDDKKTLKIKSDYAREQCLGGVMVWALSHDTKDGKYSKALGDVVERTYKSFPAMFQENDGSIIPDDPYMTKVDRHLQCKWSNCGEFCPAGWKMMTRDDKWSTTKNEIMLDDTACTSPHARRLCCPPNELFPSCGFYAFKGGACNGECPDGYREVGSLRHGCRRDYQAACCAVDTGKANIFNATRLYEACDWAEAPYCQNGKCSFAGSAWPTEFVDSTTGSGAAVCNIDPGRTSWDNNRHMWSYKAGKRKYCCDTSDSNVTWRTCTWRDDLANFGTEGKKCKSSCKDNEIKVAMEGEGCARNGGGAKSYCCTGTYKTTHEALVPELGDYENDLSAWIESPVCDASSGLEKRADSKNPHFRRVNRLLELLIQGAIAGTDTKTMTYLQDLWDKYIKNHWSNLTYQNLAAWINDIDRNPEGHIYSPDTWAEKILCNPDDYNRFLDEEYERSDEVCVRVCTETSTKRSLNETLLSKRRIELSEEDLGATYTDSGQPTWGYIAETIMRGYMTLVYEQLIYTNRGEQILEIVWELPEGDEDSRETADDRFAVWHFHFEHLALRSGAWRPGIYAFNVFHGQNYFHEGGYARVQNDLLDDSEPQARAHILECETGNYITPRTRYWYPGDLPDTAARDLPMWAERLTNFGNYLWDQDLITEATFTASDRGQLDTWDREDSDCPIRDFDWNGYHLSRQFNADGATPPHGA